VIIQTAFEWGRSALGWGSSAFGYSILMEYTNGARMTLPPAAKMDAVTAIVSAAPNTSFVIEVRRSHLH
jgi:hypothetical protein